MYFGDFLTETAVVDTLSKIAQESYIDVPPVSLKNDLEKQLQRERELYRRLGELRSKHFKRMLQLEKEKLKTDVLRGYQKFRKQLRENPWLWALGLTLPAGLTLGFGLSRLMTPAHEYFRWGRRTGLASGLALGLLGVLGFNVLSDLLSRARYTAARWLMPSPAFPVIPYGR